EGVYGSRRDAAIARARVVLNLHLYETRIFEVVRVAYLLANSKAVVAECDETSEVEPDLREAVRAVPYGDVPDACCELVADDAARRALERRSFAIFSARDEAAYLRRAIEATEQL